MQNIVFIGLAGLIGTLLRYWISTVVDARSQSMFPYGTLTVNLLGSFAIGFLFFAFADEFLTRPGLRAALFIGLLGGFTTFSSFGIQTFTLLQNGQILRAGIYVLISNAGGLALVWAGYLVSRIL
jgi:fluoride exporter